MKLFSLRWSAIFFSLLILSLFSCTSKSTPVSDMARPSDKPVFISDKSKSSDHPSWYFSTRSDKNTLRGVGEGVSRKEADTMAFADISRQIQVRISSSIESIVEEKDNSVKRRVSQELKLESDRQIRRSNLKESTVSKGVYYVAWEMDIRPDADILAERIRKNWEKEGLALPEKLSFTGPKALTQGEVARRLRQLLSSSHGKGSRSLPLSLSRKDGNWILGLDKESLLIAEVKDLFDFSTYDSKDISFYMEDPEGERYGNRLRHGDKVIFKVEGPFQKAYLSLFNVYPDGRVSAMEENLPVKDGKARVPGSSHGFFTNYILKDGVSQLDGYLAVLSQKPIGFTDFRLLKDVEGLVEGEGTYTAHKLAGLLDKLPEGSYLSFLQVETRELK